VAEFRALAGTPDRSARRFWRVNGNKSSESREELCRLGMRPNACRARVPEALKP